MDEHQCLASTGLINAMLDERMITTMASLSIRR